MEKLLAGAWLAGSLVAGQDWKHLYAVLEPMLSGDLATITERTFERLRPHSVPASSLTAELFAQISLESATESAGPVWWLLEPEVPEHSTEREQIALGLLAARLLETLESRRAGPGPNAMFNPSWLQARMASDVRLARMLIGASEPAALDDLLVAYLAVLPEPSKRPEAHLTWLTSWGTHRCLSVGQTSQTLGVTPTLLDKHLPHWRDMPQAEVMAALGLPRVLVTPPSPQVLELNRYRFELREGPSFLRGPEDNSDVHIVITLRPEQRSRCAFPTAELDLFNTLAVAKGWLPEPVEPHRFQLNRADWRETCLGARFVADTVTRSAHKSGETDLVQG